MPELPEVETLVGQLNRALKDKKISDVEIYNPALLETPREDFENQIRGKRIVRVGRRGKYIQMDLTPRLTLWFHLGMTGQLLLESPSLPLRPHTHFLLSFVDSQKRLLYRDVRRFGRIALTSAREALGPSGVQRLGPEPREWPQEAFVSCLKERRGRIKNLLLNQTLVAGLGNIYTDEVLHRAGIHPLRRAHQISRERLARLHEAMREVLSEALQWGGSSIDDYLHLDGTKGRFQNFHRVYGRGGESCRSCGTQLRKVRLSGRTSSFCPTCQR